MTKPILTIVRGLPGSGKSTYARKLAAETGCTLIEPDALLVKGGVKNFKAKLDADEYGGVPLLGVNGVVIKAHGSSNAKAIKNAVRQAKACCENGMVEAIRENIQR